ncbi:hypothetical protein H2201_002870 [Coniosporium apollinis]|uniref:Uncharacterized protein n=2 Tax=Coniosporium TaxID=2810619 RepID=A0ABQ9NXC0_9PEZI|nr:hypothetical protein H2199_006505 [Cladosporium sp. JES 115]KAJ9667036.1 hypothetical protein H2201_002870 [Coniosporium apollinis]
MLHITTSGDNANAAQETNWLIGIESTNGRLLSDVLTLSPADTPEMAMQKLLTFYKGHVPKKRRVFHRFVLLHKPVIELATLSTVSLGQKHDSPGPILTFFSPQTAHPALIPSSGQHVLISARQRDDTLTTAFYKPDVLANADPAAFFAAYRGLAIDPESQQAPEHALIIPLKFDPVAVNCVRGAGMLISLGVGLGLKFV